MGWERAENSIIEVPLLLFSMPSYIGEEGIVLLATRNGANEYHN